MNNPNVTRKNLLEVFSKRLKDSVYQKDMSYVELENILGLGKSSVSNYINGVNLPSVESLYLLSKTLKVSSDFLLGLEEKRTLMMAEEPNEGYGNAISTKFLMGEIQVLSGKIALCEAENAQLKQKINK